MKRGGGLAMKGVGGVKGVLMVTELYEDPQTDDVEVLEYLIENGCPYDYEELWIIAEERGSSELLDYLCDLEDELDDELEDPAEINTVTIDFL